MRSRSDLPRAPEPRVSALLRGREGSAAIQFAFVLPILLVLMFGGIELSRVLFTRSTIVDAANETARFASVRGAASDAPATASSLEAIAKHFAGLDPDAASANVAWSPDNSPGSTVTVTLDYLYTPLTLYVFGTSFTLSASASRTISR